MLITIETAKLIFNVFLFCSLIAFLIYIPRMLYYIEGFKKPVKLSNPKKNHLAVLVPARNEKGVVHLLDSLAAQTYDSKYFDTYVIVADKKDPTVSLCKKYKNTICRVVDDQTCKGDALDGALRYILDSKKKYAGYIIVDADNIVDKDFVLEMNNSLLSDRDIILGKRCIKNYLFGKEYRNWVVNCNGLIYTFLDKLGNCFRSKYSMHASICGTGIMITDRVIKKLGGWPYRSFTEDFELAISSLIEGRSIYYYEPAITYTEESMSHKSANDRRRRWLLGYAQVSGKYRKDVVKKYHEDKAKWNDESLTKEERFALRGNLWGCFDFLYSFIPLGVFFGPAAICCLTFVVTGIISWRNLGFLDAQVINLFVKAFIIFLSIYGVLWVYGLLALIADRKVLKISFAEKLAVLFISPFYISEYAGFFFWAFYMLAKGKKENTWVSIDRIDDEDNENSPAAKALQGLK